MSMRNFEFAKVQGLPEAASALSTERYEVMPLAGGTDLLDELKEGLRRPRRLVKLQGRGDETDISWSEDDGLRLGALASLTRVQEHEAVRERYPLVAQALSLAASPQIRNMGTVGGNLCQRPRCWYYRDVELHCRRKGGATCFAVKGENRFHAVLGGRGCYIVHPSDLAPALIAHDAVIHLVGPDGRRSLPLEEFFITPDVDITRENVLRPQELVEAVTVPPPAPGTVGIYRKVRERRSWDFGVLSVAAALRMDGRRCARARVVLGAVAPKPWPVPEVDALLAGREITAEVAEEAGAKAMEGAKAMSENGYKIGLGRRLVRAALLELVEGR